MLQAMDYLESLAWKGVPASEEQALYLPADHLPKKPRRGGYYPNDEIPAEVKEAEAEASLGFYQGEPVGESVGATGVTSLSAGRVSATFGGSGVPEVSGYHTAIHSLIGHLILKGRSYR